MKKWMAILLAVLLTLGMTACAGTTDGGTSSQALEAPSIESAVELLTTVWNTYGEDEKFPAIGGDMSEENLTENAPGTFDVADTTALDTTLALPASAAEKIDDAASLVHMMNANNFTCGAFHVKDAVDVGRVATDIQDNVLTRQWICGFPNKLVVMRVGNYVVSFFGSTEIVDTFRDKLTAAYPTAMVDCETDIA